MSAVNFTTDANAAAPAMLVLGLLLLAMPWLNPDHRWARIGGAMLTAALLLNYMQWRILHTLPPLEGLQGAFALLFLVVEMASCVGGLLMLHVLSRSVNRTAEASMHSVEGFAEGPPLVYVLIPTYNEAREIIMRTLIGALAMDYPRFRVFVLDDGRRSWLEDMCHNMGVDYMVRSDQTHGKAGNMNAALRTLLMREEQADAVAVLDADFVPTPAFLRRTVALLYDPTVGCVQTPQHFFNPDPIQLNLKGPKIIADEQRFFFDVILASKDAHGTAFSCGTSAVIRRSALEAIGLFPTESVTEDLLLSVKLSGQGWRTVYLNERLSAGLAPEGLREYRTQRGRWCLGTMQVLRTKWGPFSIGPTPLKVRLHVMDTVLFWTAGSAIKLLGIFAPILYWWFDVTVMHTNIDSMLWHLAPYWLSCVIFLAWVSRGTNLPVMAEAIGLLVVKDAMRASVIGLCGSKSQKFEVTTKGTRRGEVVVQWSLAGPFLALALSTIGGIGWRIGEGPLPGTPSDTEVMNLFWSIYNCLVLFIACMICVERPRFRQEERFIADEFAQLRLPEKALPISVRLHDISVTGCRIDLADSETSLRPGDNVRISIGEVGELAATVQRVVAGSISLAFRGTPSQQVAMIRKLFSGTYVRPVQETSTCALLKVLAKRAIG